MIAYIVASHGEFAKGVTNSSFMIFGQQQKVIPIEFLAHENVEDLKQAYLTAINQFDATDQVVFMVDLYGGTPFNVASQIVRENRDRMELITGLNLSMLIEAYTIRDQPLEVVVNHLEATAKAGIRHLEK